MVLEQLIEILLLVRMSVWTRVMFYALSGPVCAFCVPFVIPLDWSLTIANYALTKNVHPFS